MTGFRRLTMALAATALPVALTVGCASSTSTARTGTARSDSASATAAGPGAASTHPATVVPVARFSAKGLSFRYPATWRSVTPRAGLSDFPALLVYLSTARLKGTCVASSSPGRMAETCAYPIRVLQPGGVLVRWNASGSPTWRMPKANTTVAGRRAAAETKTSGGWCAVLGAAETITVVIPRAEPGHWYQMDACLRGPGLSRQEARIASMLASVRISPGS